MKYYALLLSVLLTGCSTFNVATFDNNEYEKVSAIRTLAGMQVCDKEHIDALYWTSSALKNYSEYLPNNRATYDAVSGLHIIIQELHVKENPNLVYCIDKMNIIHDSAETIQKTIVKEPR